MAKTPQIPPQQEAPDTSVRRGWVVEAHHAAGPERPPKRPKTAPPKAAPPKAAPKAVKEGTPPPKAPRNADAPVKTSRGLLPLWAHPLRPLVDLAAKAKLGVHFKLLSGFMVGALLLLGMAGLSMAVIQRMSVSVERLGVRQEYESRVQQMIYAITSQSHFRAMALLTGDDANNAKIVTAKAGFSVDLEELERLEPDKADLFAKVKEADLRFSQASARVLALYEAGEIDAALKLHLDEEHKVSHELEGFMRQAIADGAQETAAAQANFQSNRKLLTDIVWGFSGASLFLLLLFGAITSKQLAGMYEKLQRELGQRKRAEEELTSRAVGPEDTNSELESFCYSVSHDLRAPLRSIDGFSQALLEDYGEKLDVTGHDYLKRVRAATQRMGQLIDDLVGLSRTTRAKMEVHEVDLSALVEAVAADLKQRQPERQTEFAIAPGAMVKGDGKLLRIALENLLGNSWKFTAKQPQARIEFGVTQSDGKPAFFIRDNGAGFDMAYADKLFGAFQRLHKTDEFEGAGIGLATVQRVIHRHGGRIWAEGAVGKGATFYFTLGMDSGVPRTPVAAQELSKAKRQPPANLVLLLLAAATFSTFTVTVMLGPLLVDLARDLDTSLAVAGQLVTVMAITRIFTVLASGPLSDAYGRRPMLLSGLALMAVGVLGAALAWSYGSLLVFRLVTGAGLGIVYANCLATVADIFPVEKRGKAIGRLVSAQGLGAGFGIGVVALLLDLGGWRLPFFVIGILLLILLALFWVWCPRSQREADHTPSFLTHYREVGSNRVAWYALAANALQEMAVYGVFTYLAANLIQTHGMSVRETILPLSLAGSGIVAAGFISGKVADHPHRLAFFTAFPLWGGLLAELVFTTNMSPWVTVALAFGAVALLRVSNAATPTLLLELAGKSRATATAMSSFSSQFGALVGGSIGGLILATGGFSMVGYFFLSVSVIAAIVVRLKVRDSAEFVLRVALRQRQPVAASNSPSVPIPIYKS